MVSSPFKNLNFFKKLTGLDLFQKFYLKNKQSKKIFETAILSFNLTDWTLIIGNKEFNLYELFENYEYSLDNEIWNSFGMDEILYEFKEGEKYFLKTFLTEELDPFDNCLKICKIYDDNMQKFAVIEYNFNLETIRKVLPVMIIGQSEYLNLSGKQCQAKWIK